MDELGIYVPFPLRPGAHLGDPPVMPVVNVNGSIRFVTQGVTLESYICTSIAVVVFYDYFLTLDLEIQNIWRRQFRIPTVIFLLNRYLCIALSISLVFPADAIADYAFHIIFGVSLSLTLAWFFALRTYALWCCRRIVFIGVMLAYIPGFSLNLVTMLLKDVPTPLGIRISALVPLLFVFFDLLVLFLSLVALRRTHGSLGSDKIGSFSSLILNHGIFYFVLLTFLNIAQMIITHAIKQPLNAGVMYSFSSILVSRFMLRLGEASSLPQCYPPPTRFLKRWSDPTRDMIVGNMAEPLEP